nr:unnamed protein product [Spirometra erinaceieuropaei]
MLQSRHFGLRPQCNIRLDHELYAVYQNNCTRLDGNKTIHCTVEQWSEMNTVIFEIEDISRYREISLHSRYQQDFDRVSFHDLSPQEQYDDIFLYDETMMFDVCPSTDEVELTWPLSDSAATATLVECWHNQLKVCSTSQTSPDERPCDVTIFDDYTEVKLVAKRAVSRMDNYYCTIDGGQASSKAVYWQGPLHYKPMDKREHFDGSEFIVASFDDEHQRDLIETVRDGDAEMQYLKRDGDSLKKLEDPHMNNINDDLHFNQRILDISGFVDRRYRRLGGLLPNSGAITATDRRMARAQETALARFYGLPKVHKEGAPLRHIVSLKGTPKYGLARWLFWRLKFLTADSDTTVCSSTQFLEKLKGDLAIETVQLLLRNKYDETEIRLGHAQVFQPTSGKSEIF